MKRRAPSAGHRVESAERRGRRGRGREQTGRQESRSYDGLLSVRESRRLGAYLAEVDYASLNERRGSRRRPTSRHQLLRAARRGDAAAIALLEARYHVRVEPRAASHEPRRGNGER